MDLDSYADMPRQCECGAHGVKAGVREVQFRVEGTATRFSNRYRDLCKKCRKKRQYRGYFRITD